MPLKLSQDVVELMLRCWAEWSVTGQGKTPYDDAPRDPIYAGAEPIPDTPMLIEQALSELRQAPVGSFYVQFVEMHYLNFNRPTHIKLNLMRDQLARRISKNEFYDFSRRGREFVQYELQQIDGRGARPHKQLRRKKAMKLDSCN